MSEHDVDADVGGGAWAGRLRLGALVLLVVGGSLAFVLLGAPSPSEVRDAVEGLGPAAPFVWVGLYALLTVAFFPGSVLTAASGLLFGPWLGTALAVLGATAGATGAFGIGRRLGREQVAGLAGPRLTRLDELLTSRGLVAVLYLRLIPLVPFNALNYGAGVTAVAARDFVIGTAVGIVPGTFAYAALGGSLDDLGSPLGITAIVLVVVLAAAGPLLSKRFGVGRRETATDGAAPDTVTPAGVS